LIQANWIYEGHRLKQEEIDLRLKTITPEIAKHLKNEHLFSIPDLLKIEEPIPMDSIEVIIDSMMQAKEIFGNYSYAVFQKKENGIFKSNSDELKSELKSSTYKVCVSCIVTFNFIKEQVDLDTITSETLPRVNQEVRPGMTTIRSVEEVLKIDGKSKEVIDWTFCLYFASIGKTEKIESSQG